MLPPSELPESLEPDVEMVEPQPERRPAFRAPRALPPARLRNCDLER